MNRIYSPLLIFVMIAILSPASSFAGIKADVKKGNLLYNNKKYVEAAKLYEAALSKDPTAGIINFNLGDTLYKKGAYDKAMNSFNKAIASGEASLVSRADYNIGNAHYRLKAHETALQFYKRSIDLNPKDMDAKFNYEFVQKMLKESKDKEEKREDKEKQREKKEEKKEGSSRVREGGGAGKEEEKESGGEKRKQQEQQGKEPQQAEESEKKGQETKAGEQEEKKEQGEAGRKEPEKAKEEKEGESLEFYETPQAEGSREMSEEEARMLLEGYKGEEVTGRMIRIRRKPIKEPEPPKDW